MNQLALLPLCLLLGSSLSGAEPASAPQSMTVVPVLPKAPVIDGEIQPGEWQDAARLEASTLCETSQTPAVRRRAWIRLARDANYLYCAAVCEADMKQLARQQEAYLAAPAWSAPRLEMFFGNQDQFTQIVTDYTGRIYKNFKEPFFCKVSHAENSYTIELAMVVTRLAQRR